MYVGGSERVCICACVGVLWVGESISFCMSMRLCLCVAVYWCMYVYMCAHVDINT